MENKIIIKVKNKNPFLSYIKKKKREKKTNNKNKTSC